MSSTSHSPETIWTPSFFTEVPPEVQRAFDVQPGQMPTNVRDRVVESYVHGAVVEAAGELDAMPGLRADMAGQALGKIAAHGELGGHRFGLWRGKNRTMQASYQHRTADGMYMATVLQAWQRYPDRSGTRQFLSFADLAEQDARFEEAHHLARPCNSTVFYMDVLMRDDDFPSAPQSLRQLDDLRIRMTFGTHRVELAAAYREVLRDPGYQKPGTFQHAFPVPLPPARIAELSTFIDYLEPTSAK